MTLYTIYQARNLQPFSCSISDLILAPEECLVWALNTPTALQIERGQRPSIMDLQRHPLAANYYSVGSADVCNKILLQDPFQPRGPYLLDRRIDATVRIFRKQSLRGIGRPELVDVHVAGDKIPGHRFYFVGEVQEVFRELERKEYFFEE